MWSPVLWLHDGNKFDLELRDLVIKDHAHFAETFARIQGFETDKRTDEQGVSATPLYC